MHDNEVDSQIERLRTLLRASKQRCDALEAEKRRLLEQIVLLSRQARRDQPPIITADWAQRLLLQIIDDHLLTLEQIAIAGETQHIDRGTCVAQIGELLMVRMIERIVMPNNRFCYRLSDHGRSILG